MAEINAQTGEPQSASGWSTDGGDDASAKAAKALTVDSPMSKQYLGRMDALTSDMEKNFAKQQEAEAPYRDKMMKVLDSPQAAEAHLEKVKEAPKPEDYQKYSLEFASAMAVIGAIGGKWTRNVGNSSLNAFAGALKGWQSGNQEAYENAAKEWQQNTQKTLENNRAEMEKYHEIINNKKLNIDQMMAAMNLVSAEYQNKIMFDATVAKNYTMAFAAADKMEMAQLKLQGTFDKLQSIREDQKEQVKAKIDYLNAHPDQMSRMNMKDYLTLKGAAEKFGFPLTEHPQQFLSSQQPRSAAGLATQKFMEEHPDATADEVVNFAASLTGAQAGARTGATRAANLDIILNSAKAAIPQALAASEAMPRGQWVTVNKAIQAYQTGTSDPKMTAFAVSNLQIAELWARAMNPTGVMREGDRELALKYLNTATSPEAYKTALSNVLQAINREKGAVVETEAERKHGAGAVQGVTPPSADINAKPGWSVEEVQ